MAKIEPLKLASDIIERVGGTANIQTVSHCVTRLRFVLKNRSLAKDEEIKKLNGVLGVVYGSGQFQVILGENLLMRLKSIMIFRRGMSLMKIIRRI